MRHPLIASCHPHIVATDYLLPNLVLELMVWCVSFHAKMKKINANFQHSISYQKSCTFCLYNYVKNNNDLHVLSHALTFSINLKLYSNLSLL